MSKVAPVLSRFSVPTAVLFFIPFRGEFEFCRARIRRVRSDGRRRVE